jgi:hypothetical protein
MFYKWPNTKFKTYFLPGSRSQPAHNLPKLLRRIVRTLPPDPPGEGGTKNKVKTSREYSLCKGFQSWKDFG